MKFIVKSYFGELYQTSIGIALRLNKDLLGSLGSLKQKTMPEYQYQHNRLNTSEFKQQYNQYRQFNTRVKEHRGQLEKIELDHANEMFAEKIKTSFKIGYSTI